MVKVAAGRDQGMRVDRVARSYLLLELLKGMGVTLRYMFTHQSVS